MRKILHNALVCSLVLFSMPIAPLAQVRHSRIVPEVETNRAASYLRDLAMSDIAEAEDLYSTETKKIAAVLGKDSKKSPILIDQTGNDRELIIRAAASRISSLSPGRRILAIEWTTLFSDSKSETEVDKAVAAILSQAEASRGKDVLYLEDVSIFSKDRPLLGSSIAAKFYDAIAAGRIQVLAGTNIENFTDQIASDIRLKNRFSRVDIEEDDPFVGDKLAPDLRALVASGDAKGNVKVILQSDDINNPELRRVLARNNVQIESRVENLEMLVLDLPVRVAEEVASIRGVNHLSLDRELKTLGHIEKTTGSANARTVHQGLNLGLLGMGILNTSTELDGAGVGIAIVDSSIREDHRSFVNKSGAKRIVQRAYFTNDNNMTQDEFGHGTHVASLAAGGGGANLNLGDGSYISSYEGIASGAKIINLRVLDDHGIGSTARLINALDWILANRATNNIRVVNLSLGAPSIETWRNDPLCRAVRRLTEVGIVVVAAAGNHGKTPSGQKIYGAIHSPGNDPTVITVGASNTFGTDARIDDGVTTYSSRGPTRSYWTDASGAKHFDNLIKPDLIAPGNWIIGAQSVGNEIVDENENLEVENNADDKRKMMYMSGTSMATPIVSGTAALMLQANPKLTPNMVKMVLQYTAQRLAGFNTLEQGAGQLNIEGAARLAFLIRQNLPNPTPQGEPLLTTTTLPLHSSTVGGTKFQWPAASSQVTPLLPGRR